MSVIFSAIATFISTLVGGLLAIRYRKHIHLIMGFAAGVILGVISFDIFPEIIEHVHAYQLNVMPVMVALVVGFLLFHILEKVLLVHHAHEDDCGVHHHTHPHVGVLSAFALAAHSFMDGIGIGLGFQINSVTGILVALAVISHDFTDGMNTVTLMLANKNSVKKSVWFLLLDAITPTLGALSTLFFTVSPQFLVIYLGFFAGFLLYIGASDILPQAHSQRSSLYTVLMTILGVVFVYGISLVI